MKIKQNITLFFSNWKAEVVINGSDGHGVFKSFYTTVVSNIQKSLGNVSGWIIDSIIDHKSSFSKYKPLVWSSYIELPKELNHPRKGLSNTQSVNDKECFKWCLVRYLHPADHNPKRFTKAGKDFAKKLYFKDT